MRYAEEEFKKLSILCADEVLTYAEVAGYRETDRWLVIRQGVFPNETITKISLDSIVRFEVS